MLNNFVKLAKSEWSQIKKDYNEMREEIKSQKVVIKKQSDEIAKLMKYKENDDLLFSYETSRENQKNIIKSLEQELMSAKKETEDVRKWLHAEKLINDLMVEKLSSQHPCHTLDTVSILDIRG